jgi:hypothetical protein
MITILIAAGASLAYAAGWRQAARYWYRKLRPYTEPLSCNSGYSFHEHSEYCYQREHSVIESAREAAIWAGLIALIWPLALILAGLARLTWRAVASGDRPRPEELQAKIARLERELREPKP